MAYAGPVGRAAPRTRWPGAVRVCCTAAAAAAAVGQQAEAAAAGGVHGFPAALTSFIGRDEAVREVAGLLGESRLVTVTGPGGAATALSARLLLACDDVKILATSREPLQVAGGGPVPAGAADPSRPG